MGEKHSSPCCCVFTIWHSPKTFSFIFRTLLARIQREVTMRDRVGADSSFYAGNTIFHENFNGRGKWVEVSFS